MKRMNVGRGVFTPFSYKIEHHDAGGISVKRLILSAYK